MPLLLAHLAHTPPFLSTLNTAGKTAYVLKLNQDRAQRLAVLEGLVAKLKVSQFRDDARGLD